MGACIFTKNETSLNKIFPQNTRFLSVLELSKYEPENEDISYFDVSGFTDAEYKKILTKLKSACKNTPWGIIDIKGIIKDPALLFFQGASDYLGPLFFKETKTVDSKRLKEALAWHKLLMVSKDNGESKEGETSGAPNTGIKLPAESSFSGWQKVQAGKTIPFYFLYCSLQSKIPLDDRLDSKTLAQVHKRFLSCLENNFQEGDGLLWMNSGKDCLFLIPPKAKSIEAVIKACISMIVSSPQIVLESLGVSFPVNFVFALHYDSINYKPPGKTGTIVSEAINFIFHLGTKKAEHGRLTVSGGLPDKTIPQTLQDCFLSAGEFEGHKIWHTKRFSYVKPWF